MNLTALQLGPVAYLIPLAIIAMVVRRNTRARRLRLRQLWMVPLILMATVAVMMAAQPVPGREAIALDAIALLLGGGLGWWRGRFTTITVDPETHALTSKASPLGMLLILSIFALRFALRSFGTQTAGALHVSVLDVTDSLMLVVVGMVCVQRLEMALRASRLLGAVRA